MTRPDRSYHRSMPREQSRPEAAALDAPIQRKADPAEGVDARGQSLAEMGAPVQRKAEGSMQQQSLGEINAHTAQAGVSGGGGQLPHLDRIQRSFGKHDVSGVQAHVGGEAANASAALGAHAYAT